MNECEFCGTWEGQHDHWKHIQSARVAALEEFVTVNVKEVCDRLAKIEAACKGCYASAHALASVEGRPVCPTCGEPVDARTFRVSLCSNGIHPREAAKDSHAWACPGTEKCDDDACDNVHAPAPIKVVKERLAGLPAYTCCGAPLDGNQREHGCDQRELSDYERQLSSRVATLEAKLAEAEGKLVKAVEYAFEMRTKVADAEMARDAFARDLQEEQSAHTEAVKRAERWQRNFDESAKREHALRAERDEAVRHHEYCIRDASENINRRVDAERERVDGWWHVWLNSPGEFDNCKRDAGIASGAQPPGGAK